MKLLKRLVHTLLRSTPRQLRYRFALRLLDDAANESDLGATEKLRNLLDQRLVRLEDRIRQLDTPAGRVPGFASAPSVPPLERFIMHDRPPWREMTTTHFDIPGMITQEEIQYYHWLSPYYSGEHELVELGPWLGHSTMHLATAFGRALRRQGKRIHVYDDFIWRPGWMNQHLRQGDPAPPHEHASFAHLFHHFTSEAGDLLEVHRGKITDYDGNENLPAIAWGGGLIELLVVDCGRTIMANQPWLDCFSSSFIPNRTLIVMQDWRLHRERPRKHYNQTLLFTAQNPRLELVHEITNGGIASFLYR